ncbi:MAG: hypothetical protein OEO20_10855 [Gemmatimonadota bacterium]|nr:hypothetical protein [Gemmatimonadota bacterium]MDH3478791.1 hypothetical protein [Gemmatimonadota bacterium]MDH3570800.1 hypothetical protein [Gemmatimonadota bacterium]MDH5548316.1 hypothetical protein [Gemmatimonadota bacterium]
MVPKFSFLAQAAVTGGLLLLFTGGAAIAPPASINLAPTVAVSFPASVSTGPLDGRIILVFAVSDASEPRNQVTSGIDAPQVFGIDVDAMAPGTTATIDGSVFGYPMESLNEVPTGRYYVQAVLHKYETFRLATGHTVKLPMDRGEGQNWRRAPGNLYSRPRWIDIDPQSPEPVRIVLDRVMPPIPDPPETTYVKHVKIQSKLLTEFWGRPMYLGAHVLLPKGFDEHPEAQYPLMVFHGHFPYDFGGFRTEPPDTTAPCTYSARFDVDCYNRIQQGEAYDFYRAWTSDTFPRFLIIEVQHANPYYDDSYAVNSANLGPYGDALQYELIPHIEERFRGIGEGWARFTYGGSTGGWEALAVQVFYPDEYNGTFAACPDPIDFRAYTLVNLYEDENAYFRTGPFKRVAVPGHRNWLGQIDRGLVDDNHLELVIGTKSRSGGQWDIWEAVYSPMGDDGYPQRIWDKRTGTIDPTVAAYWKEHYDLRHILERDLKTLGPKLEGKIHIYVGDMDNYYLNNAVYLMENFLERTRDPYYGGEVDYGNRAEHCWNGDQLNGNHISRLRYNTMYVPKILKRMETTAPPGADVSSWRY